jgi:dipeptidyl aminopeptidase/acylaminoacyl peptidase
VYFTNFSDQRVYRTTGGGEPTPITPSGSMRFADLIVDRARRRLIGVCENHRAGAEPVNTIVSIDLSGREDLITLVSGSDFYASPRLSPDGRRLAWLAWDHPNMPWDGTTLWLADIAMDGRIGHAEFVAGGENESVSQPEFSSDGVLHFISDRSGWWNLYRLGASGAEALRLMEAEFARPQWVFGLSTYAFAGNDTIVCAYNVLGNWRLGMLNRRSLKFDALDCPYTDIACLRAQGDTAVFIGASASEPPAVIRLHLASRKCQILRASTHATPERGYISCPETIVFPTQDGESAHAFYYAPRNKDFRAAPGEKPPLLVISHGGPTSATSSALNLKIQFWTSRGFAVVDVNYRGSTGYGRRYRRLLDGAWGIVDVADCVSAPRFLNDRSCVDGERLVIRGSSAGGFTTLCALVFHETFKAGAVLYGVSDLEALARDTHKFESHYLERLIGPYSQCRELYVERSPIHHAKKLSCPVIFFQGLEDKVVPPDQTERMVDALREKGVPVAYLSFEGEQHGFRKADSVRHALEGELYFYSRIFRFSPADPVKPVIIENL